ncbi:MAG: DegT/DnrJ/EryC1/StrS family aminotransferase [Acidobacteriaceae bacterium]
MKKDDVSEMSRRTFLATASAAALTPLFGAASHEDLALHGGRPVRSAPLTTQFQGANFIDDKEKMQVAEVVDSRNLFRFYGFTKPEKARNFELDFAKFIGAQYGLAVTSGTAALHIALNALGVGPGDEVILPAWTWYSCYNAIVMTGALPVFAETNESFTMDPEDLEKKITPQTKAVMPVHVFGSPADMDKILPLAREHNLKVLEDSAEACGCLYKGQRTGSMGDISIFSFQVQKMITSGEGGAVVTNDPHLYERAIRFHDLGQVRPVFQGPLGVHGGEPELVGLNYRMNEETGAIIGAQLAKLDTMLDSQRKKYQYLRTCLSGLQGLKLKASNDVKGEIGIALDIILPSKALRDKFLQAMDAENVPMSVISASVVLPIMSYIETKQAPHPRWPSFTTPRGSAMRYGAECCPRTVDLWNRAATLSVGPKYSDDDLKDIVRAITKVHAALLG